jgi:pilus assembly protein CpaE
MQSPNANSQRQLTAILVSPDRELAAQLMSSIANARSFQVLAEFKTYPARHTLDIRLRQLKPEVLLLDVASDETAACDLIEFVVTVGAETHVIGLHRERTGDAVLKSLRAGAVEFLHAPFDAASQLEAAARLLRLRVSETSTETEQGQLAAFSSVKPGSGASTIATQTTFAASRMSRKRILLADFDFSRGMVGFYLKLNHRYSVADALKRADRLDAGAWAPLPAQVDGVDVLCAPSSPVVEPIDAAALQALLDYARTVYDWVVVDLPPVFERISLLTIAQADFPFLVSTSELPSLHLARRATTMLHQLGFPKERFKIIANRISRRDGITPSDMEKLFNCSVHSTFPNDYFSLHRMVTLGKPLGPDGELGRAVAGLANFISGQNMIGKKTAVLSSDSKLAFSAL